MKDNKKLNSEQESEHFASLRAGCASQQKISQGTFAGIKKIYSSFTTHHSQSLSSPKFFQYESPRIPGKRTFEKI